jgi:peptide/nickel transport system substrate-binding protein
LFGSAAAVATAGCGNDGNGTARQTVALPDSAATAWTPVAPNSVDIGRTVTEHPLKAVVGGYFHAPVLPIDGATGEGLTSGHTWTVTDGGDERELSVPCVVAEYEIESTDRVRLTFDDRFAYWNGESLDGRAYWVRDRARWLGNGGAFEEESFPGELLSDTEYRSFYSGAAPNQFESAVAAHPGVPPVPPSVTEPWIERFENATTEDELADQFADYVGGKAGIETVAEEGYGTGPYRVESADDVRREARGSGGGLAVNVQTVYARPWSAYPGPTPLGGLEILGPTGGSPVSDQRSFVGNGTLDVGSGVIAETGDFDPSSVAEGIEQVASYPSGNGLRSVLVFHWGNDHLRRLWVRRALVAAAPFEGVADNVGGASVATPAHQTGLPSRLDERVFDREFLDSLVEYPLEADQETAATWLGEAGYERDSEGWVGPDGGHLGFEFLAHRQRDETVATSLAAGLESFGVSVEVTSVPSNEYESRALAGDFDLAVSNAGTGWRPTQCYGDWFEAGVSGRAGWLSTAVLTAVGNPLESCRQNESGRGPVASTPATVTLPTDPALEIDGVDYPDGGTDYLWSGRGEDRSVCEAAGRLWEDTDTETHRDAARVCTRWYNYALPTFQFVQDCVGLWADTESFSVPETDHPSLTVSRQTPASPHHYHLLVGTVRPD